MLRRQFLFGLAAIAATPVPASAGRMRFRSRDDRPEVRRLKWWIGIAGGAALGLIGVVPATFWVLDRLDQAAPESQVPPFDPPKAETIVSRGATQTATAASAFGRRTR